MKVLKKLKLNALDRNALEKREMNSLKGGCSCCTCGCHYETSGGSSSGDNDAANSRDHLKSYGGGSESCSPCGSTSTATMSDFWKGKS